MLKSKELRQKKVRLEASARSKLAEITTETNAVDARRIEDEHAAILAEAEALTVQIRAAKKKEDDDANDEDHARADDADADEDDDDEADGSDKKKRKARAGSVELTRAMTAELVTIDTQARGLGIELNLTDAITRGEKPDEMRKRLFAELAKKSDGRGPRGSSSPSVEITRDESEGRAASMEIALITRMLQSRGGSLRIDYNPKDARAKAFVDQHRKQSEQYLGMGLVEIAAACIDYRPSGRILTSRHADDILTRAFNSTSDFPSIFQNVLNKSLLARYELATPTYRQIAAERNFNDFRPHPQIRAGEFPALQAVTETGEIKYGSSTDNNETISVVPYGVIFSISRQMLVNDDLSAIDQILGSAGDVVLIFENTTFFNMMLTASGVGPTLVQDGLPVFNVATHLNQAAVGVDPSVTSVGAARAAMRSFKSISGNFLNVPPAIILTGPAQETIADQMVASITPTLTTSYNPFSGRLASVSDANILDNSWYLFADPGRVPCFAYGFLNGANGPRTRTFEPFGVQGVKVSLEHDFGVGAVDFRGAYRTPLH